MENDQDDALAENPRAVIGGNLGASLPALIADDPAFADAVSEWATENFGEWSDEATKLLNEARELPKTIDDDEGLGKTADVIKKLRDLSRRMDTTREGAKAPYRAGAAAIDGFFFPLIEKCQRRDKKQKPGAADVLQSRADDYQARKLAAEQERRRQEAEAAAKAAREATAKAEAERQAAIEAERAAARARKPETAAAKEAEAAQADHAAAAAEAEARLAAQKAEAARVDTLAKPADMVRTRSDGGAVATMGTEPYALVEDFDALDKAALWPFIKRDAIEAALRSWAKTTNYSVKMTGASVGRRPKTQIR